MKACYVSPVAVAILVGVIHGVCWAQNSEPDPETTPTQNLAGVTLPFVDSGISVVPTVDGVGIFTPSCIATFGKDRTSIGPVSGDPALSWNYQLESVRIGDASLFDRLSGSGTEATVVTDQSVQYQRAAGLVESYEGRATGIEQTFRIESPPESGGGDLQITASFKTALQAGAVDRRGVIFSTKDGLEAICYGNPTLIDAEGRTVSGSLVLDGNELRLKFSTAQLVGVQYPITIDPLIGNNFTVIGNRSTQGLLTPNGESSISQWTFSGATSYHAAVSDSSDSSCVTNNTGPGTKTIRFEFQTGTKPIGASVTSVVIGLRYNRKSGTPSISGTILISGTPKYSTGTYSASSTKVTTEETWNSGDLSQFDIDNLQVDVTESGSLSG